MSGRLEGKTAVITGATGGIGAACARRFAAEGARVLITGRDKGKLDKLAAEIGPKAVACQADVASLSDLEALVGTAKSAFGAVDALLANAGMGLFAPLGAIDEGHYARQFDINVKGVLFTVQTFLPLLKKGSSVILTTSVVIDKGMANLGVYSATKAAVRSFGRTFANELGPRGVRVNCISPGYVPTEFQAHAGVPNEVEAGFIVGLKAATPTGEFSSPHDIAAAALFLASDDSANVTGINVRVDGGFVSV